MGIVDIAVIGCGNKIVDATAVVVHYYEYMLFVVLLALTLRWSTGSLAADGHKVNFYYFHNNLHTYTH